MEIFSIKNLSFTYPDTSRPALSNITLDVNAGDFIVLIGESGCGKTTLLRMLKRELTPFGKTEGEILYKGNKIEALEQRESASQIGFILQDPDSQTVTDKVYSELAFGLENLGYSNVEIRTRVSEFAAYFGLSPLFHKSTNSVSGGEKQLLNLASAMAVNPQVIILDEPVSQLDPIASTEFINTLKRLNNDFGTTVIIAEHNLQELFPIANKIAVMESGSLLFCGAPNEVIPKLKGNKTAKGLPASVRVFGALGGGGEYPLTLREGREFLQNNYSGISREIPQNTSTAEEPALICKDLWFRYDKSGPDVLRNCGLKVYRGELYSILGENGSGKSTLLKCIAKRLKPYRGSVNLCKNNLAYLPQNPKILFVRDTLEEDLGCVNNSYKEITDRLGIDNLLTMHPYDLSAGQLQKAALAKVLLTKPDILLLDEPTKGLDAFAEEELGIMLSQLILDGLTIIAVTHDIEFAACYSNRCGLLFDGNITAENYSNPFFTDNNFYTTAAAKMSKNILKNAVTVEDIVSLCRGEISE